MASGEANTGEADGSGRGKITAGGTGVWVTRRAMRGDGNGCFANVFAKSAPRGNMRDAMALDSMSKMV